MNIGAEIRELEMLINKLGAALSPVLRPRLEKAGVLEANDVPQPGYLKRLKDIRHGLNDILSALEI